MPHMIILPAAGVAGYAAWRLRKGPAQAEESDAAETPEVENPAQIDWEDVSDGATLGLEIGYGLIGLVDDRKGAPLLARITCIRWQLSTDLGFVVPLVRVTDYLPLGPNCYRTPIAGLDVGGEG